jgi:hypothetical protein
LLRNKYFFNNILKNVILKNNKINSNNIQIYKMSDDIHEIIFEDIYNYNVLNTIQSVLNNLRNNNILNGASHSASHNNETHNSLYNSVQTFLFEDDTINDNNESENEYYELDITIYHDHNNDIFYDNYFKSCNEINSHLGKSHKIKEDDPIIGENCMICMEEYKNREFKRIIPKCQHIFHKRCIDKWLQQNASCPVCRCDLLNKKPTEQIESTELNQTSEIIESIPSNEGSITESTVPNVSTGSTSSNSLSGCD